MAHTYFSSFSAKYILANRQSDVKYNKTFMPMTSGVILATMAIVAIIINVRILDKILSIVFNRIRLSKHLFRILVLKNTVQDRTMYN